MHRYDCKVRNKMTGKLIFLISTFSHFQHSLIYGITIVSTLFYFNAKTFSFLLLLTPAVLIHDAQNAELLLPKKPTTTPTPYIFTTVKPPRNRNKQQHNHQHKTQHDSKGTKDIIGGPNQIQTIRENEANAASEGKLFSYHYSSISLILYKLL